MTLNPPHQRPYCALITGLLMAFILCGTGMAWGQVTIYSQDFNSSGGSFPTGWSSSGSSNQWFVYNGNNLSPNPPFSGGYHVVSGNTSNSRTLTYASVSTLGYSNITVIWAARRINNYSPTFSWSADGGTSWTTVSYTDVSNNSTWAWVNNSVRISLPGAANFTNIRFRWVISNSSQGYRIDDFSVQGTLLCSGTPTPGNTISTANPVCAGSSFTLSLQNATPGSGLTYQWQSSEDGNSWNNFTPASLTLINTDFASIPASTNVYGNASVNGGELILTPATGSQTGGFVIQTTPGANISPFSASFDYRIWDGSGADGMSLSYGPGMNNNAGGGEAGEGNGIIVSLDTYDNNTGTTNSQIRIYYAGVQVWNNTVGAYNLRNTLYRNILLTVENNGYLSLTIGGTSIVSGLLLTGYATADKTDWKFKFSGRTGGATDKHSIDNLTILMGDFPTLTTAQNADTYYRCNVTCSGNTGTSTELQVNIKPTFTTSYTDVSCFNANNGTITVNNASGGTAPYEYSIYNGNSGTYQSSNVFTGLAPGTYKVRVKDASGCESPSCP